MGTLGSPWNGKFSGFSFCLINPGVGAGEAYNLETPMGTHKNKDKNKSPAYLTKGPGKWQDRKLWDNNHCAPAKCRRQKLSPPLPTSGRSNGKPRSSTSLGWNEALQLPQQCGVRRLRKLEFLPLLGRGEHPTPILHSDSINHVKSLDFHSHLSVMHISSYSPS